MFIEGSFSWDTEGERTSLEWPPLMSPDVVEAASGQPEGEIVLATDPDLTTAEMHGRHVDSLVSAAFFAEEPARLASGAKEDKSPDPRRVMTAEERWREERWSEERGSVGEVANADPVAAAGDEEAAPIDQQGTDRLDEAYECEDEDEQLPGRRLSKSKGPIFVLGTAVAVALWGGYAAEAFGWRLPPNLRESAQPMKAFLWNLAPSRLVGLMATEDRPARPLVAPDHREGAGLVPHLAHAMQPADEPLVGSTPVPSIPVPSVPVPSDTEESVAAAPSSPVVDPANGQARLDRDHPDSEAVATSRARAADETGQIRQQTEQTVEEPRAATGSPLIPPAAPGQTPDIAELRGATRAAPLAANRDHDHLPRPWHGLVWSPAAHGLVPAVPAVEDKSTAAPPRAAAYQAVPAR